jgi:hypothetical protein
MERGVTGNALSFTHMLANGSNRMILLAVAGRSLGTGGSGQARPETVTYGGAAMTLFGELNGGNAVAGSDGQGHIFYYYLVDPLGSSGSRNVQVSGEPGSDPAALVVNLLQFNGVRQTTPISAQASGLFPMTCQTAGGNPNTPITLATSGSVIYSMAAAQYSSDASANFMLTQTLNYATTNDTMRVLGGYRGTSPILTAGEYRAGWNFAWCSNSVHYVIAIHPAQAQ